MRDLRSRLNQGTVPGHVVQPIESGWMVASSPPGATDLEGIDALDWIAARVPGTAAGALATAGAPWPDEQSLDDCDWWFRVRFAAPLPEPGEEVVLCLDGIATVARVHLNGRTILESSSMFQAHGVDVGALLEDENELVIQCLALSPLLAERRRPRARWRTRIVADQNLRFFRTAILGRAPGFAPGPAPVGPWRPIRIERRRTIAIDRLVVLPRVDGAEGVLAVRADLRLLGSAAAPGAATLELAGPSGTFRQGLTATAGEDGLSLAGSLTVPDVERWWPHTHGEPALHAVRLLLGDEPAVEARPAGFRHLQGLPPAGAAARDGIALRVNDVPVFARGAVWTPADPVGLAADAAAVRAVLERVREAGMNMLRVCGLGTYEDAVFHGLCDELGILVWQDLMFANFDYPYEDAAFGEQVDRELDAVLADLAGRPSLAVVCGNSEVEQQVAMLGLDPAIGRPPLFAETVPAAVERAGLDAVHVPSAPCGGDLPFRPDVGIANYYGVGGYRRPLSDVRRSGVRFAAECLALSNVPDDDAPQGKRGVPRDAGSDWDFEDVRDHYLADLHGVDVAELRRADPERYLDLSRSVTGEVMATVFGEWRRAGSPCGGALVLWLRDLVPGAGWGVLDHHGEPKVAYHHLRRALAPVGIWMVDEGLGGVDVHVANDRPQPLSASVRVALYRDGATRVDEVSQDIELPAHGTWDRGVEALLGRFVDASWAYRFGPPAQDVIVASLEQSGGTPIAQAFAFPAGPPRGADPVERTGLRATCGGPAERPLLTVGSTLLAYGVRVCAPGFRPTDDAFCIEPGGERTVALEPRAPGAAFTGATVTAINASGAVRVQAAV